MSIKEWAVQLGALENVSHTIVQNGTVIQRCREKLERRGRENAMREALRKVIAASTDNRSCVRQLRSILNELERLAPRVGKEMELMRLRKAISSLLVQVEQSQTIAADVQERGDLYELNDVPMGLPKRHNENPWRNQSVDARPKWHANHSVEGNVDAATGERIPLLGTKFHATSQDQKCRMDEERRQKEEEYALSLIRERTNSLQEIQSSIEDVHEIMKDIQKMALEQGEKLEDVSINMAKASDHMNQGANELSKTEDAARSSRRRLIACWFCTLLLLATIFITERYW